MNYAKMFTAEAVNELFKIWASGEFYAGIWATLYTTLLATFFALVIGLPLGVLLVAGREDGVLPLPKPVMAVLNALINILRSVPFLILMIMVMPLSRLLMGTSVGTKGTIVPLVVAAFPFMARLIESSLREVDAGMIAVFELGVWAGCVFIYLLLHHFSRRYESLTIKAEIYIWKLDIISSLGVSIAFFIQMGLQKTEWAHLAAYIDPLVAIVMACLLLVEPVKMIFVNLKNLVLFAPDEHIMNEIRQIAEKHMDKVYYDIEFLDVIQTGRKTWVELYITSHNDMMNTRILHQLRNEIREELREKFDQVYVELIPDLPED